MPDEAFLCSGVPRQEVQAAPIRLCRAFAANPSPRLSLRRFVFSNVGSEQGEGHRGHPGEAGHRYDQHDQTNHVRDGHASR